VPGSATLASGAEMPLIGLGTWQLDDPAEAVADALEAGYRLIDTSGDYGTQPGVGRGIASSSVPREEIFLVTKVEEDEDAYESSRSNLNELGVDEVDLMLIHRPPPSGAGEALWEGLLEARRDGLTREIGVSNYSTEQVERLHEACGERPSVNQVGWSPFDHDPGLLADARRSGVVIQAYSPLSQGRIEDETLAEIGRRHGRTVAQVALRWCVQLGVVPLPKAGGARHRRENLEVFDFELDEAEMGAIGALRGR
jgi:2,5-diketo-D-gluconate reductase A